jgi:hypothetical protein
MTNVIVDAGTDAKIARFQKRGIEMMEVGVLEPVEVWGEKERGREKGKRRDSLRLSVDEVSNWSGVKPRNSFLQPGGGGAGGNSRPVTPSATSSKTSSLHSSSHSNLRVAGPAPVLAVPLHTDLQQQQQQLPILDSTMSTPMPVLPPHTQTQVQFMTQTPPQKRNIFNKLFNKRSNLVPAPPTSNTATEPEPTFGTFSLHPAPVTHKVVVQDFDNRRGGAKSKTPPALVIGSPPLSPSSQQTTPRQTPRMDWGNEGEGEDGEDEEEGLVSPTPTVAPPKERGHGRNSSLTVPFMNNPFKTTLIRSGKNRLSAVVGGNGNGNGGGGEKEKEKEDKGKREERKEEKDKRPSKSQQQQQKRDASPANVGGMRGGGSRSQLNLPGGGGSNVELNGGPLMLTQSQAREELSNLKQQQLALRPPILGIQPTFVSPAVYPPNPLGGGNVASPLVAALSPRMSDASQENLLVGQRALMYVWLVRKWLKRRPVVEGEGGHVFGESGLFGGFILKGTQVPGLGYGGVEVRFEWKRAKVKSGKEGRKVRRGRASTGTTIGVESDDEFAAARERTTEREKRGSVGPNVKERLLDKRRNRMSTGSFSTTTASEEGGGGGGGEGSIHGKVGPRREGTIDDGEDSDPEDSETPWVCTLKIRRMANAAADIISPPASAFSDGGFPKLSTHPPPHIMRLKVGTLSPTPHHPKVVAMLKVPFPLPDVEVERMGVVRRKGFAPQQQEQEGEAEEEREPYYGLTLTAEEIKDIVCSTGLWLVVREGFGGVGKVSRKGDGWRIRA